MYTYVSAHLPTLPVVEPTFGVYRVIIHESHHIILPSSSPITTYSSIAHYIIHSEMTSVSAKNSPPITKMTLLFWYKTHMTHREKLIVCLLNYAKKEVINVSYQNENVA